MKIDFATQYVYSSGIESPTVSSLLDNLEEMERHYFKPISRQRGNKVFKFYQLAYRWRAEIGLSSSITQMAMHPAYQEIIGMGKEALPLILFELERNPDHWFWALTAITGEDPVKPEDRGRIKKMAEAWLNWGREHGYR